MITRERPKQANYADKFNIRKIIVTVNQPIAASCDDSNPASSLDEYRKIISNQPSKQVIGERQTSSEKGPRAASNNQFNIKEKGKEKVKILKQNKITVK